LRSQQRSKTDFSFLRFRYFSKIVLLIIFLAFAGFLIGVRVLLDLAPLP